MALFKAFPRLETGVLVLLVAQATNHAVILDSALHTPQLTHQDLPLAVFSKYTRYLALLVTLAASILLSCIDNCFLAGLPASTLALASFLHTTARMLVLKYTSGRIPLLKTLQ